MDSHNNNNKKRFIKSSKARNKSSLYHQLQMLRDVSNSSSVSKTSIVVDASKYIEELKEKVERLNQEIGSSQMSSCDENSLPMEVGVETLEKGGFLINVYSEKNCSGLLVSILQAFEELGLDVHDARVSCDHTFQLQAIGGENNEGQVEGNIDAQMVKQAILEAINNWSESNEQK